MAGDWIKMRGNLWDDPRVAKLCDLTDQSEASVVGGLYWLWATADQHSEDGVMPGLTLRQIDRKTGIQGFGESLVAIGWLADHPEGVRICRFEEHNGASAKKRCQNAKRVEKHRAGNDYVTQEALQKDAKAITPALARERVREREDKEPNGSLPPYPQGLDAQAWERWVGYRKQIGKSLKPASIASAQQSLAKHGANQAAVVEQSIANGWQGLFELKTATVAAPRRAANPDNFATVSYGPGGAL